MWSSHQRKNFSKTWRRNVKWPRPYMAVWCLGAVFKNARNGLYWSLDRSWHFETGQKFISGELRNLLVAAWSFLGWCLEEDPGHAISKRKDNTVGLSDQRIDRTRSMWGIQGCMRVADFTSTKEKYLLALIINCVGEILETWL